MSLFGIEKTLQEFANQEHKITRRKLKSWIESQNKVKGGTEVPFSVKPVVKGRKTSDANRDTTLFEWCIEFQKEKGRPPTRKEAAKRALELSSDEQFKASKGWLDKFSKKYQVEFTPLKVFPSRGKKIKKNGDGISEITGVDSPENIYSPSLDGSCSYYSGV